MSTCNQILRLKSTPYPRTCAVCGIGPCKEIAKAAADTPNDGGPVITQEAFNKVIRERDEARAEAKTSLRDRFAGNLAPAIYQTFKQDGTASQYSNWQEGVAIEAYRIADAMLAARDGKEGN